MAEPVCVPLRYLAKRVTKKRGVRGLRGAAAEIGIDKTTLFRIQRGEKINVEGYIAVCKWLAKP